MNLISLVVLRFLSHTELDKFGQKLGPKFCLLPTYSPTGFPLVSNLDIERATELSVSISTLSFKEVLAAQAIFVFPNRLFCLHARGWVAFAQQIRDARASQEDLQ